MTDFGIIIERAQNIQVLLMDCDGVLTDGHIMLLPDGQEIKAFNAQDGHGMKLAQRAGLRIGIITGRKSFALEQRATEVGVEFLYQDAKDKNFYLNKLISEENLNEKSIAFMGDDLPDLPIMNRVGLSIAVQNAVEEVKSSAHYVTKTTGGNGAVREAIEIILKIQKKWQNEIAKYLG